MKDSPFVHELSSSNRVPELIPFVHRVSVEYQNQFPNVVLGMPIRTLPLPLVIRQPQINKERKIKC